MMDLIFLVPIISVMGIFIGVFLKFIAPEEIKFGKFGGKYFIWMKRIILFLLIILNLLFSQEYLWLGLGIIAGFLLGIVISEYLFLGTSVVIALLISKNMLFLTSSLVLLYGLPYGSIMRRIRAKQIMLVLVSFFLPFLILLYDVNLSMVVGFASGGLFNYVIRK